MPYLFDTDWSIDFLAGRTPAIALLQALLPDGVSISIVTYMEIVEGILGSRDPAAGRRDLRGLLQGIPVLGISEAVADRTAAIRLDLRGRKRQINHRSLDLLIAATALEHELALVTRNTRDYEDIPGLLLYAPA